MRTFLAASLFGICALAIVQAQARPDDERVLGTWTGPVRCLHGGGDTFTMSITRDGSGRFVGTMDWALANSDGRKGTAIPFTTLTIDGTTITATGTADGQTAQLEATVKGETITGTWRTNGVDDTWTFTGTKTRANGVEGPVASCVRFGDIVSTG